ncbi:MAG TPA: DinB family protein [Bryobacteraceae bacterium]|jgi:uncharacterized damage-inducible protein DinB
MTPEEAIVIRDYFVGLFKQESATTRRVITSAPIGQNEYAPSEKCMKAGKLLRHIAESEVFFLRGIADGEFKRDGLMPPEADTPEAIIAWYDENEPAQLKRVSELSGEHMIKNIKFFMWDFPALQFLPLSLMHAIHHRGQLSAYLRPMGGKVPSIYGPSGDDDQAH